MIIAKVLEIPGKLPNSLLNKFSSVKLLVNSYGCTVTRTIPRICQAIATKRITLSHNHLSES